MIGKSTLQEYRRYSRKYVKEGPWNIDSIEPENVNPCTIVDVKEMMKLHKRILRLINIIKEGNHG